MRRSKGLGKAKALEFLHAADQGGASVCVRLGVDARPKVDNAIMLRSLGGEHAIELGPTIGLDLGAEIAADLDFAPLPEFEYGQMRGAGA